MMDIFGSDLDYETYTETSDSEDQDDNESAYIGHAQTILSSLDESIGKIDNFLEFERGFVHGDIVCSIKNPSGQLGRVLDVDMVVDLETTSGELIKDVNSKKLLKVRSFESGDYVVQGSWLGRVDGVLDVVTVVFNDGARCEIMTRDADILMPVSSNLYEDAPYPYYPGQQVQIKIPNFAKSARWLCGSWKANQDECTICNVEIGLVHVNWIASVLFGHGVTPSNPPLLQDPKALTLLSCFPHANWQLGDWCTLPSDHFQNLQKTPENSALQSLAPHCLCKAQKKFGTDEASCKKIFVIAKTKTKVDVLWQDGSKSVGLDSQALFPVHNIGDHDFWPEQYVLEKVTLEDVEVSTGQQIGIVKKVDAQERTVEVIWISPELEQTGELFKECTEETVSAYELIEHPDFSYCIGDVVFRLLPHFEKFEENLPAGQANGRWQNNEVLMQASVLGKDTLKKKHIDEVHDESVTNYLSYIGNVVGFRDGGIEVKWATGLISMVQPSEILGLDQLDDPDSQPGVEEDAVPENTSCEMVEQVKQSSQEEEKVIKDSSKVHEKVMWDSTALSFPWAAIKFVTNVAVNLFGFCSSISLYGSWKGVSELECLKTEELQVNVNVQKENLNLFEDEVKQNEQSMFSPGNGKPGKFKQFDIVDDYSDHHFVNGIGNGLASSQVNRCWLKKIQQEWNILEKDLPDGIHVRVYEERIDLLRASIAGAYGTPYHDGLFFFDIFFPPDYPNEPPLVHYNSGGLRLNPNLYESGKVCLSLLKTWTGTGTEVWNPKSSTILQVLLSLQALVLNEKPYFNEAGYDKQIGRAEGEKNSITYNENAFILSCKTMLYLLRKPPKHFEALVAEHFACRSHHILLACKAYMDGALVGCPFKGGKVAGEIQNCSTGFKIMLAKLFPKLVSGFTEKGIDCIQFLDQVNQVHDTCIA